MAHLTTRQREVIRRRIELRIAWTEANQVARDHARYLAERVVDELDRMLAETDLARRAILRLAEIAEVEEAG